MTFSDSRIGLAVGAGSIKINPFDKDQINPASYDLEQSAADIEDLRRPGGG